jgi:DNA polymerase V
MTIHVLGRGNSAPLLEIPIFLNTVSAGFPSPAADFVEKTLDLNELCVKHPAATYFVRVEGESMIDAGILAGDVLVVDRALKPRHGQIVIAEVLGEMTVKQLELHPLKRLVPRNRKYPAIDDLDNKDVTIFGVVTGVVRSLEP